MGLLQSTVDEGQWGKSVLEEEVEEVPAWYPRECLLALQEGRKISRTGEECVCVCVTRPTRNEDGDRRRSVFARMTE